MKNFLKSLLGFSLIFVLPFSSCTKDSLNELENEITEATAVDNTKSSGGILNGQSIAAKTEIVVTGDIIGREGP